MTLRFRLDIAGRTDTGRVRSHNEDSLAWDEAHGLAVLADGMGGYSAGEVASQMATTQLLTALSGTDSDQVNADMLIAVTSQVNSAIYQSAQETPGCEKMGTTMVALCLTENGVLIGHIGDSRAYRLRGSTFSQLTEDHSLLRQMLDDGTINEAEAHNSRYRNVVTRALGVWPECEAQLTEVSTMAGDIYLLCSDGLSNMVGDEEIAATISSMNDCEAMIQSLVDKANQAGGEDNISVIVARVVAVE